MALPLRFPWTNTRPKLACAPLLKVPKISPFFRPVPTSHQECWNQNFDDQRDHQRSKARNDHPNPRRLKNEAVNLKTESTNWRQKQLEKNKTNWKKNTQNQLETKTRKVFRVYCVILYNLCMSTGKVWMFQDQNHETLMAAYSPPREKKGLRLHVLR